MRERALAILLLLSCVYFFSGLPPATAQSRSELEVILGTTENDIAMDMVLDSTGSVIIVGRSEFSVDPSQGRFYAVKVSSSGETLWAKIWNVTSSDILTGVTVDSANNILMLGACNLTTDSVYAVIYKFDPDGVELWSSQIDDINYAWYPIWWPWSNKYCLEIEMFPTSDDIFVVGSFENGLYTTFVARYNSSGSQVWCTEWYGPSEFSGSIASLTWLSSQNSIAISGILLGNDIDPVTYNEGPYLVAFDFDGNQLWNYSSNEQTLNVRESSACFDIGHDEYIYATYAGRNMDHIVRSTYDLNETWSFNMLIDDQHSVYVSGFLANGTDNLIGYGEVKSLVAGRAVTKSYQPASWTPQPPQTLIFSFTAEGELLWYDYLVLGRISASCGCQFDSNDRLIVAGHTSVWSFDTCDFYIVYGFVQTPFPSLSDDLAIFIFPIFNILALCSIGGLEGVRSRWNRSSSTAQSRLTLWNAASVLLIGEFALYVALYEKLVIPFGGFYGAPPPIVYLPYWVEFLLTGVFYSLAIPTLVCLVIWFSRRRTKP